MWITCATVLIKTSLHALEIYVSFHLIIRFVILSYKSLKVFIFNLPPTIGRPRYFSQFDMIRAPSMLWISIFTYGCVFLLKKKEVFCRFIAWPDASSYCCNRFIKLMHPAIEPWQKRRLSSAKSKREILTPLELDKIPCREWFSSALRSRANRSSAHNNNKYGNNGSFFLSS